MTTQPYPDDLSGESAYYALSGPIEQQIAELRRIIAACAKHSTTEARELEAEAREYLAEIADA